ncbi:uncharacterized protein TNIN_488681 [Trichonephila inaurata madagascariensis]|uniref:Uncharacterized protein n=1 Tax=Trichonephila inaurata madagascariensis TaxID=2747483 RepID=A0A8X6XBF2_9ARAC|nr:uncharacterized protein TNIN_488681 [Trichonephila inaurata madagascariensis]
MKRMEKFNSYAWTDMVIEQTLMKSMKTEGGVSHGRSTQESVLCKWVFAMYAINTICDEMEKSCTIFLDSTEQHVDDRDSRVKRDNTDVSKLVKWFALHNPFPNTQQLVSLASVMVGNDQINCHKAHEIGLVSMVSKITGLKFNEIKLKRSDQVLPLLIVNKSVKINGCRVSIDPLLLFQRITVSKQFERNLQEYSQYELSPYLSSLIDNEGMRKTTKATLYDNMTPVDFDLYENNVTYIIDESIDITTKQARDDADVLIVETALEELEHHRTAVIVGEDIDLLVILIGCTQTHQEEVGCDTTSAFFKKGKKTFIRILENLPNLDQLAQILQEENCHVQTLHENGIRVLLAICNAPKSENRIDNLCYTQFIRSTKLNKPVQLSNLPPTSAAAHQLCILSSANLINYSIQYFATAKMVVVHAVDRKSGLQCSLACGQCNGQACFNASRYENDLDEDCTFDPEILQDLETNILDDENN